MTGQRVRIALQRGTGRLPGAWVSTCPACEAAGIAIYDRAVNDRLKYFGVVVVDALPVYTPREAHEAAAKHYCTCPALRLQRFWDEAVTLFLDPTPSLRPSSEVGSVGPFCLIDMGRFADLLERYRQVPDA